MSINDQTALLFTHVPEQIVKEWRAPVDTAATGIVPLLSSVKLTISFNRYGDVAALDVPSSSQFHTGLAGQWKQSLKLYDELDLSVNKILESHQELYNGRQGVLMSCRVSATPNPTAVDMMIRGAPHEVNRGHGKDRKNKERRVARR